MQITDPLNNPRLYIEQVKSQGLQSLRSGQAVQMTVLEATENGTAKVKIGGTEVALKTQISLQPGQKISVEVIKSGEIPEMRINRDPDTRQIQAEAYRSVLPKQAPLDRLFRALSQFLPETATRPTPAQTRHQTPLSEGSKPPLTGTLSRPLPTVQTTGTSARPINTLETLIRQFISALPAPGTGQDSAGSKTRTNIPQTQDTPLIQQNAGNPSATKTAVKPSGNPTERLIHQIIDTLQTTPPAATDKASPGRGNETAAKPARTTLNPVPLPANREQAAREITARIQEAAAHTLSSDKPVTAERIRDLLLGSGLFLESSLAAGKPPPPDLKSSLLRLLFQLQVATPAPAGRAEAAAEALPREASPTGLTLASLASRLLAELQTQTEGALARLQLNQLSSLPQDDGPRQVWQFEIPVKNENAMDNFLVRLEKEEKKGGASTIWSVALNFNIEPLGPIIANLTLSGEEISSHFTVAQADSMKKIEQELPRLTEAFIKAGLKIGKISARQGKRVEEEANTLRPPFPLLDEKA